MEKKDLTYIIGYLQRYGKWDSGLPAGEGQLLYHCQKGGFTANYRTISMTSHASKILLKVIMKRMENKLEEEVSNTQAGFRKNRGTRDHIFNLMMIIQKYREVNTDIHTCFIDYSKAFDCVRREILWQTLQEMNFDNKIISPIKSLYEDQQSAVQLENGTTQMVPRYNRYETRMHIITSSF